MEPEKSVSSIPQLCHPQTFAAHLGWELSQQCPVLLCCTHPGPVPANASRLRWALMLALHVNGMCVCLWACRLVGCACMWTFLWMLTGNQLGYWSVVIPTGAQRAGWLICQDTEKGITAALVLDHKSQFESRERSRKVEVVKDTVCVCVCICMLMYVNVHVCALPQSPQWALLIETNRPCLRHCDWRQQWEVTLWPPWPPTCFSHPVLIVSLSLPAALSTPQW